MVSNNKHNAKSTSGAMDGKWDIQPHRGDLKNIDGWLAPDGTFYACDSYDHLTAADKLAVLYGYQRVNNRPKELNGELTLENNRWVKISLGRVVIHNEMSLTKKQIDFLFDYYEKNGQEKDFKELIEKHRSH